LVIRAIRGYLHLLNWTISLSLFMYALKQAMCEPCFALS
jgi:hypothetical protein